jgi:hypothetical protein
MKRQYIFAALALIAAIPALVMVANLTTYAFVGSGFLPEGTRDTNAARGMITWLSATMALVISLGAIK